MASVSSTMAASVTRGISSAVSVRRGSEKKQRFKVERGKMGPIAPGICKRPRLELVLYFGEIHRQLEALVTDQNL